MTCIRVTQKDRCRHAFSIAKSDFFAQAYTSLRLHLKLVVWIESVRLEALKGSIAQPGSLALSFLVFFFLSHETELSLLIY